MGATTGFTIRTARPEAASRATAEALPSAEQAHGRRRIDRRAGLALEMLGHAIEYLADEYVYTGNPPEADDPALKAVQILMAANREIYFSCPVVPTLRERWDAFWQH